VTTKCVPLDPDLMKRLMDCVARMSKRDRSDLARRTIGLIKYLDELPESQAPLSRADTLISFDMRMQALAVLQDRHELGAWRVKAAKGGDSTLLHEVMVETAATEPLIDQGGSRLCFDPQSFLREVLRRSEAQGKA
jgi:hypothetical protein